MALIFGGEKLALSTGMPLLASIGGGPAATGEEPSGTMVWGPSASAGMGPGGGEEPSGIAVGGPPTGTGTSGSEVKGCDQSEVEETE